MASGDENTSGHEKPVTAGPEQPEQLTQQAPATGDAPAGANDGARPTTPVDKILPEIPPVSDMK
jgi:hypothetical protein